MARRRSIPPPPPPPPPAARETLRGPGPGDPNLYGSDYHLDASRMAAQCELTGSELYGAVRHLWERNLWIESCLHLKSSFANFGLRLAPADATQAGAFKTWLGARDARGRANRTRVEAFIRECWAEWLLLDNLIVFWRDNGQPPILLAPEQVTYSDALGVEKLAVRLGLTAKMLEGQGLTPEQIRRYTQANVTLSEAEGEYFQVLRRGARGRGLARPRLARCFLAGSQAESMEVGEALWALAGRLVMRANSIGFEVRTSGLAPQQVNFLYDAERAEAIDAEFRSQQGLMEFTKQFDHKIEHLWSGLDPRAHDARKWESLTARFGFWAGGLGQILTAKTLNPNSLTLLRTEITAEREQVAPLLEDTLTEALRIPGGLKLSWGNRCFADARLAWQMVVDLMRQGPLALRTALTEGGFDPEQEGERKRQEAPPTEDAALLPKFDSAHGTKPGQPTGGRPPSL